MAILKAKQVREFGTEEQNAKLAELREELSKERGHIASGTRPDNPGKIRMIRRTVARILTIQHLKNKKSEKEKEVLQKK